LAFEDVDNGVDIAGVEPLCSDLGPVSALSKPGFLGVVGVTGVAVAVAVVAVAVVPPSFLGVVSPSLAEFSLMTGLDLGLA